jgi:hypothetical protein
MTFILLWLLRFIGLAIIQDKFNDMIEAGTSQPASSAAAAAPAGFAPRPATDVPAPAVNDHELPPQ